MVWLFVIITGILPAIVFFKRKTYYEDRSVQGRRIRGAAVVISNHTSLFDFMMYIFLFLPRKLYFLVAEVMYRKSRLFGWFLRHIGGVLVDRATVDPSVYGSSLELLADGRLLLIFPEGRLETARPALLPFMPGAAFVAAKANVPIIPVYTDGNYHLFRRTSVMVGNPIMLSELEWQADDPTERLREQTAYLRQRMEELGSALEEARHGSKK